MPLQAETSQARVESGIHESGEAPRVELPASALSKTGRLAPRVGPNIKSRLWRRRIIDIERAPEGRVESTPRADRTVMRARRRGQR